VGDHDVIDDTTARRVEAAIELSKTLATDLGLLTEAMTALREGIALSPDQEKDRRRDAYIILRGHAVSRFPQAPAHKTDPWAWEDFRVAYQEREGKPFRGTGDLISAVMVAGYLGVDRCDD
jgi:hypothetical protein